MPSSLPYPDLLQYATMAAVVFGAAIAQGVGGVGFAMFAAPVAAMFFPQLAPGPLLSGPPSTGLRCPTRWRDAPSVR
jgi:uncharacterized membrane protein YfcA